MKFSAKALLVAGLSTMAVAPAVEAVTGLQPGTPNVKMYQGRARGNAFTGERAQAVRDINSRLSGSPMREAAAATPVEPSFTLGPAATMGDIDGPDGEVWFFTMNRTNDVVHYEWFDDYFLKSYEINIYDGQGSLVGTIKDIMRYGDDELRVPASDVLPIITRNFFNDDDKYEVIVSLAINTFTPGIMHNRSLVYQLGGEKDEDGNDKVICTLPAMICDVVDATKPGGREEIYMTTVEESDFVDDGSIADEWEWKLAQKMHFTTYRHADNPGEPVVINTSDICYQNLPGDQEYTPFMLSTIDDNGDGYLVFSQYEEPLFEPWYSYSQDIVQRTPNALVIDLIKLGETAAAPIHTRIPFTKEGDDLIGSFYSIGDLRYKKDIVFEADGTPTYIVTRGDKVVGLGDESLLRSYYVYNADGTVKTELFKNANGHLALSDLPGQEAQHMFVEYADGTYIFHFYDLESATEVGSFSYMLEYEDGDPDRLSANLDRVAYGDSYAYVVEMLYPSEDEGISYMRFAWLDKNGKLIKIDEVPMGKNVMYAQSYISEPVLHTDFYHTDKHNEYMILIKRGTGVVGNTSSTEQLLVGQPRTEEYPDGRDILFVESDSRGQLGTIVPFTYESFHMLAVGRIAKDGNSFDYYRCPLNATDGITDAVITPGDFTVAGDDIIGDGFIEIFNLQGIKVAAGTGAASVADLPAGVYILRSGDKVQKIVKK